MSQLAASVSAPAKQTTISRLAMSPGLFRIVLATVVVISHSLPIKFGLAAVYLSFTLSGFWVYRMWHTEYLMTSRPYLVFLISRLWRLVPVYLAAAALMSMVLLAIHRPSQLPASSSGLQTLHFYFSNLFILGTTRLPGSQMLIGPAWSLDLEIQFYIIAPILIMALTSSRARFYWVAIVAISLVASAYSLVFFEGPKAIHDYLPMVLIFFLIGMAYAQSSWAPNNTSVYTSLLVGAAFMVACVAFRPTRGAFLMGSFTSAASNYNPLASFILALLLAPYAMTTVAVRARSGFLAHVDRDLSNISYEVYLLHLVVLVIFGQIFAGQSPYKYLPWLVVPYGLIGLLSWAIYQWIDRPIDARRRQFVKGAAQNLADAELK